MSQFANTVFVVVDAEGTDKPTKLQDGSIQITQVSKEVCIHIHVECSIFDFHGSCNIGASQNKACSYGVMLVLRDRIIRSFRHELGSTGCCLRDSKCMSIDFFNQEHVLYIWFLTVEVGIYLRHAIFNYFYHVINTKGHLTLVKSNFHFSFYLRLP